MTAITAQMVKQLREKTGAGMMDAKKALSENGGDMDAALDWLRTKGLAKAAKKAGRTAAEGLVGLVVSENGTKGAITEINSETDFVARNELFQSFVTESAQAALETNGEAETVKSQTLSSTGKTVQESLTDLIAKIGENMTFRRSATLEVSEGVIATYTHNATAVNLGKIGVLIGLESSASDKEALQELGRKIAMHVAAAKPVFLSEGDVDSEAVEREKAVLTEQAKQEGKPDAVVEKMVIGRMRKFYEEVCLLNQIFVMDGETKIATLLSEESKNLGSEIKLTGFTYFILGEGIEKDEENFAEEVKAAIAG